jgi:outer membrane receptor protein involved in Fe transport
MLPLASAVLAAVPVAFAQEQPGLEEIIVTAQKRTESLQDVPVSVLALDTTKLEELRVQDMDDYLKFLPSVSYQTFGPGFAGVYMRGVASGENRNHSGPLPSVGMYLDEQPITTIQGPLDVHMFDIQRVEALAGPQGTLFGASSQSGTIRIITNKPDPTGFSAAYNVSGNTVEHGGEGYAAEGYVNVPVTDNIAVRLVGWGRYDAGYIDNEPGTRQYFPPNSFLVNNFNRAQEDVNDVETFGGRGALKIDLNDRWTVTGTVMGQVQDTDGTFSEDESKGKLNVVHFFGDTAEDSWVQGALTIEGKISNLDLVYSVSYLDRDNTGETDYSDYTYFYDVYYYDLYGSGLSAYLYDDAGNFINPTQFFQSRDLYSKHSQELRLSSPSDWRFRFVTGLYFQRQFHSIEQRYRIAGDLTTFYEVTGWPDTIWLTEQDRIDRDYAIFGEFSYDIQDNLTLTAGLRVFKAKNSLKGFFGFNPNYSSRTGEAICFDDTDFDGAPCIDLDKAVKEYGSTPKISLSWKIDDDRMIYGTISRGYRPGGINRRGTFPPYVADFLTNFELGWKSEWRDNTLRFNGAFFYERWEDFQFSFLGENGLTNITNAGAADVFGVEADFLWVPTDQLTVGGGFSWIDADLTEDFCLSLDADGEPLPEALCAPEEFAPSGTRLPVTASFKTNATARYSFNAWTLPAFLQGSVIYNSSIRPEMLPSDTALVGKQDAYVTVDFSAGVEYRNASLEVFLDNAFDERYDVNRFVQCNVCTAPNATLGQPRTLGIKFGQKF